MKKIVILLLMLGILAPLTVRAELKSALEMADDFISKNNRMKSCFFGY